MVTFLGFLPSRRGKIDASRQDFLCGLFSQEVTERMRDSQGLPALRQKVTGGAPLWDTGRGRPGQQAGATLVAGATNVAPSPPWKGYTGNARTQLRATVSEKQTRKAVYSS
jgi:hypothetical protein